MQADIDLIRDVYMTRTQREAYERILAIAEGAEADRADARRYRWLRERADMLTAASHMPADVLINGEWCDKPGSLDAAIDAARAGAVTQGEG